MADRIIVEGETADGLRQIGPVDRIIAATGQRPDLSLTRELRLDLDPWLESAKALGPLDRSQRAFLRLGAAARASRAGAPGARLLHRRRQELWPSADLPAADRLRAGPLDRSRDRRRSSRPPMTCGSCCPRPASARRRFPAEESEARAAAAARRRATSMRAAWPTLVAKEAGKAGCGCADRGVSSLAAEAVERTSEAPSWRVVIPVLGVTQILAWGSSYYLLAVLAEPIAGDTGWPLAWVVGGLSLGLLTAGLVSPRVGDSIERHGGRPVLAASAVLLASRPGRSGTRATTCRSTSHPGSCSASAWAPVSTMRRSRRLGGSTANGRQRRSPR